MTKIPFDLGIREQDILHRYFTGVARVAAQQLYSPGVGENVITADLCRMFGPNNPFSLPLNLKDVQQQLANPASGTPIKFGLALTTHNQIEESKISGADIGLIFTLEHNGFAERRAILIQAKRLYTTADREYKLDSRYGAFNGEQHKLLTRVAPNCSSQYLLYNPELNGFSEADRNEVLRCEDAIAHCKYSHCHRSMSTDFIESCTGLRVLGANVFPVRDIGKPTLRDCYQEAAGASGARLITFADFIVYRVLTREFGSEDQHLIDIAAGKSTHRDGQYVPNPAHTLELAIKVDDQRGFFKT